MDDKLKYVLGTGIVILICVLALALNPGAEFGGADGSAEDDIAEIDEDYEPWFESFWVPAGETESMLFALQAAVGGVIIGYFIGGERQKRRSSPTERASVDGKETKCN